jgi:hypothetical protein
MAVRDTRKHERRPKVRRLAPAVIVGLCTGLSLLAGTAQAQFFGDRYYNNDGYDRGYGEQRRYQQPREDFGFPFGDRFIRPAPPPADYSKAPPPRKLDNPPTTSIVVIGDSFADWLAYGLDETYSDQTDTGVVRKVKATAGLIRYDAKNEALDWPGALKDALAGEKPNAIVVMLGLNDRIPLKDVIKPVPAPPKTVPAKPGETPAQGQAAPAQGQAQGQAAAPNQSPAPNQPQAQNPAPGAAQAPAQAAAPVLQSPPPATVAADTEGGAPPPSTQQPVVATGGTFDFHTDKWAEVYGRRIDEMINALKGRGVPIIWVGLPSLRGTKSTSEMAYLDEIYRERAEKAGITYVDIWDGFVDDQGRFTVQGPDFEGQTRKLRTPDGVQFTKAGAVKLASYVDQELRRMMANRAIPVALPGPETPATAPKPAAAVGTRPDLGPVVPLAAGSGGGGGDLLGGGRPAQITSTDPVAAKVLTRGDAIAAPAGRADDFAWPRRAPGPNAASVDTGPMPGPEQAAPPPAPKKPADAKKQPDGKNADKGGDGKTADSKSKQSAPDQGAKPRRSSGATLDGAPRPPRDVGGGF